MSETRCQDGERRNALLILHGRVASREEIRTAVSQLRSEGNRIEVRVTWEPGDGTRFAAEAADENFGVVIAGGGDGTVNEVAQGLFAGSQTGNAGPALAVLPLGTANDFARTCRIPDEPLPALRLALSGRPTRIDVGRVGDRVFVNMATGGFGARVTTQTDGLLKQLLGPGAYLVSGLANLGELGARELQFEADGFTWSGPVTFFAVGNSRTAGGGNLLCPDALIDDGLLDLRILPHLPPGEFVDAVHHFVTEGGPFLQERLVAAQLRRLEIRSDGEFQVNLDGEPVSGERFRIAIEPEAILLCLPEEAPVLSGPKPE